MKNNRLHITFNESLRCDINEGYKESYRVKRLERAKEIIGHMNPEIVQRAMFKDSEGTETDVTPKL